MSGHATRRIARGLRLALHVLVSAASLLWFVALRRGSALVFTHVPDVDADGRDNQMGPLVDALRARGERPIEVTLVTLDGGCLSRFVREGRPFLSHAVLLAAARLLAPIGGPGRVLARRRDVAHLLLRALRPRVLFLIDESGSGQMLLRAARSLGIRTVGVQHGDFQPGNPQYDAAASPPGAVDPADVLCVWSPWFRARLLAISAVYEASNTRVTGRLRHPVEPVVAPRAEGITVLLLSEARPGFPDEVEPYLEAIRGARDLALLVHPHPAEPAGGWDPAEVLRGGLGGALARADVALGVGSSALLEALFHGVPAIAVATSARRDPAGLAAAGVVEPCERPEEVCGLCRDLAVRAAEWTQERRERVWGGAQGDPAAAILASAAEERGTPHVSAASNRQKGLTPAPRAGHTVVRGEATNEDRS